VNVVKVEPLVLVQSLRALAALLVLAGHTQGMVVANAKARGETLTALAFPGGFGVDLFFCISGFIMVVSSKYLFGAADSRSTFIVRRATRLVPLYWIATLGMLPLLIYGSHPYGGDLKAALATSLLFWPYPTYGFQGDAVFPVHTLGWSLNYEVFFYLLFSLFIVWPMRRAVIGVCLAILAIVVAGSIADPQSTAPRFWVQPIILEFAFGALIGWGWLSGLKLNAPEAGLLAAAALLMLMLNPFGLGVAPGTTTTPNDMLRVVSWGLPAVVVLFAAVAFEQGRALQSRTLGVLRRLGDSSYSLYLMHPFALILVGKAWTVFRLDRFFGWPVLALAMVLASIAVGLLSYRWIEQPATRWIQQFRVLKPRPAA
jgi:exopolysaccharide production protein ExoZ